MTHSVHYIVLWCVGTRMKAFEVTMEDGTVLFSKLSTNAFPKAGVRPLVPPAANPLPYQPE